MTELDSAPANFPEDVIVYAVDCEAALDYAFALYLGRTQDCSILIEEWLLKRFSFGEKLGLLKRIIELEGLIWAPYETLVPELQKLFDFRNAVAHSAPDHGNRFSRKRRRAARNEVFEISADELAEQMHRGMRCQSAVWGLPTYLTSNPRTFDPPRPPQSA
ncbi:hypothetical protein E1263_25000 [Kribbella antibiotica]|uniref:Apea-like HEPN domain-containing protein n=1 Tax=Kribbella antibiotica TaxID=190195 RepID=A0A4R4ZFM8_9ACTN|nr:hypothetical protein [Kribbella antibiotica]TDD56840.1 hypothetical protein E1263_25000 [Kribbella antibiotica]